MNRFDPFQGGKRPSWGDVGAHRFRQANQYAREDVKTYIDNVSAVMGPPGTELSLVGAGILLRYVGTGIHWFVERLTTPRNERAIAFDGPGIYIVACAASPVLRGEGFVRAPSVVWMPVFVRTPEEMAQIRLDAIVKADEDSDARLETLKKKLDEPVSWLDHDAMVAEAESIFKSQQGLDETLSLQVTQLTARRKQIENDDSMAAISERSAIDDQLKALNKTLDVRKNRASKLTGTVERVPAVFVGDKGQVLTLALEATQQGTTTDDDGKTKTETWYVSDLTTPNSDDAEGTGATKAEAIEAALKRILEGTSSYGRGTVSFAVGRKQHTIRITASEGSLMLEAVENLATVASIRGRGRGAVHRRCEPVPPPAHRRHRRHSLGVPDRFPSRERDFPLGPVARLGHRERRRWGRRPRRGCFESEDATPRAGPHDHGRWRQWNGRAGDGSRRRRATREPQRPAAGPARRTHLGDHRQRHAAGRDHDRCCRHGEGPLRRAAGKPDARGGNRSRGQPR